MSAVIAGAFMISWRRRGGTFWSGMAIVLAGALVVAATQAAYLYRKQRRKQTSALLNPDPPEQGLD